MGVFLFVRISCFVFLTSSSLSHSFILLYHDFILRIALKNGVGFLILQTSCKEEIMGKLRLLMSGITVAAILVAGFGNVEAAPVKTNFYGLDGLFMGTTGTTLPAGQLVVGASMLVISDDDVDGSILPVNITYGATDSIELAAAFETYKSIDGLGEDESGTGDLHLLGKFAVQGRTVDYPATAVGVRIKLPMADDPLGTEETDFALFGAVDLAMRSVKGILNVEYVLAGGDYRNQVNYVVGLEIPYSDSTDFTLELLDQDLVGDMFAGGATFDMGPSLNFGVAVGVGLDEDTSADFAVMGKLDFNF